MDLDLCGRKAFVSGSTQGIGFAIARSLLDEGASVVVNGREEVRVRAAVEELQSHRPSGDVSGVAADLADPVQVNELLAAVGEVDILVNSVGLFEVKAFEDVLDEDWQRFFEVNVMSAVRLCRALLGPMLERGWGRIIFVSSEAGVSIPPDMLHYGVTKAGALALSNGLAKRTRGSQVTVNTILGGPTYSDGVAQVVEQIAEAQGVAVDELKQAIIASNPTTLLQRFIRPDEIASLAVYLASPLSAATNGAALRADGGVLTGML